MKATIEQAVDILKSLSYNEHVEINISIKIGESEKKENQEDVSVSGIIAYLNNICGTSYRTSTSSTVRHINARVKEGFSENDFKKVIDFLYQLWSKDEKMKAYLRPETMFGSKFESYLNRASVAPRKNSWGDNV